MQKVKIMLKQQADQAHYAALMEGIQKNCLTACDNDSKSALGKIHTYVDGLCGLTLDSKS